MDASETGADPRGGRRTALRRAGDALGGLGDLGTFLPLAAGAITIGHLDATGVLFGFGLFAIATGLYYRVPVPVQPMKLVAAVIVTGAVSPGMVTAAGMLIGACMLAVGWAGAATRLGRALPQSVRAGIQVGIGAALALAGVRLGLQSPWLGAASLVVVLVLSRRAPVAAVPAALLLALAWRAITEPGAPWPVPVPGLHLPVPMVPTWSELGRTLSVLVVPQLPLTLANAVILTAALAPSLFPGRGGFVTERRLAVSTGLLNLGLAPLGAMPMCHGSGGMVAQQRFGARTGLAPCAFGALCLLAGVVAGDGAGALLAAIPVAALGALLLVAGVDMAISRRLFDARPSCVAVIVVTAATTAIANPAWGLLAGIVAEGIRVGVLRLRARPDHPR